MSYTKPLPVPDEFSSDYWEGAREHRLVLKRCADCAFYIHPPRPTCPRCQSERVEPAEVSGKGAVYSFSIMYNRGNPGFDDDELPYAVVTVELAEQPGLITVGNLLDCPPSDTTIGMPVEVTFQEATPEITLPQWRPLGERSDA